MTVYRCLLWILPAYSRRRYGPEMEDVFQRLRDAERRKAGLRGVVVLWIREVLGMVKFSIRERARQAADRGQTVPKGALTMNLLAELRLAIRTLGHTPRSAWPVVRDALRSLRAAPGLSAGLVLILTVGIAASVITFSVVDAVVLRPLPYHEPDRLVTVGVRAESGPFSNSTSAPVYLYDRVHEQATHLAGVAAGSRGQTRLEGAEEPVVYARVTASLFEVLGIAPIAGQTFTAANEVAGEDAVAVIGYELWQRHFGGDPDVAGKTLRMGDRTLVVLGVMPPRFTWPIDGSLRPMLWTPFVAPADERSGEQPSRYLRVVGRLAPHSTVATAQTEADAIQASVTSSPEGRRFTGLRFDIQPASEEVYGSERGWMLLVLAGVGLVMLVACANVASLLLVRAARRARELSVRASLGASRTRLVASLLTESLLLAVVAGGLGVLVSVWGVDAARAWLPLGMSRADDVALNLRVLTMAVSLAAATGLVFGTVPAWTASRIDLIGLLKDGASSPATGRSRWRSSLLVAEVAFISVLLVATTLFVASFVRVTSADLGFERRNLLLAGGARIDGQVTDALEVLTALPGVAGAGAFANGSAPLATAGGFGGGASGTRLLREGADSTATPVDALFLRVTPGYFEAAGIARLAGRDFTNADLGETDRVVLDARTARLLFGDVDPVGAAIQYGNKTPATVVGVVGGVLDRGPEAAGNPYAYLPSRPTAAGHQFLVRTTGDAATAIPAVTAALGALRVSTEQPVWVRPIDEAFSFIVAGRRFAAGLMGVFGVLAVFIGAVGIFAVMASVVAQRRREIGIRMALGATPRAVLTHVGGHAVRLVAVGLAIGLPTGYIASRGSASVFFGVTPADPSVYMVVATTVLVVGLLAAALPAAWASRTDVREVMK